MVTRPSGQTVRERIEKEIQNEDAEAIIVLNFSKIGVIDYSCADEIVAKLISRLLGGEYGNKYIVLMWLNENQEENIGVALERKGLAVIAERKDGEKVLLGALHNYLKETLNTVINKERLTAKDLSEMMNLEANTSGTRLLNLHKKRLVKRTEEIREGGRVWVYEAI